MMINLVVIRGGNPDNPIGNTDIRIFDHMRTSGIDTTVCLARRSRIKNVSQESLLRNALTCEIEVPKGGFGSIVGNIRAFKCAIMKSPDILIINPGYSIAGLLSRIILRKKIVIDVRSIPVEVRGIMSRLSELQFFLFINLPIWNGATYITEGTKEYIIDKAPWLRHKTSLIWGSGVDDSEIEMRKARTYDIRAKIGIEENAILIVYQGSFTENRGLREAIEAMTVLPPSIRSQISFLLIGDGPIRNELERLIDDLKLQGSVRIIGPFDHDEVMRILREADIGICLLPDLIGWRISSPLKVHEYCAAGLILILSDIEPHKEFQELAIFIDEINSNNIAKAIQEIIEMKEEQNSKKRNQAQEKSKTFTWSIQARSLARYIREMI